MKKTLSIFSANLLFALTLLLVVSLGSYLQMKSLPWGLVATEVAIIALPTLVFLQFSGVPRKKGLRLNPISLRTGVMCVLLGVSIYLVGLVIEGVMAQLTGFQAVPIPSSLLPKTGGEMAVYFVAISVFAPLCEEILFRGAVQGAYENKKSARFAITITAFMFAFYHLRLSGLPALLPIAFILSYVVWKTDSIYAGMLVHFGNNATSGLQNITYFTTGKGLPFISLGSALVGLILVIALLVRIRHEYPRLSAENLVVPAEEPIPSQSRPWLAVYWPVIFAGVLYCTIAGMTLVQEIAPRPASSKDVSYGIPSLRSTVENRYEIKNKGGQRVGEMDCTLTPEEQALHLDCTRNIQAYEYQGKNGYFQDSSHTDSLEVTWESNAMDLVNFAFQRKNEDGSIVSYAAKDGQLARTDLSGTQAVYLAKNSLIEIEWVWHAALLKANSGQSFAIPLGYLEAWDERQQKSGPRCKDEVMRVYDDETLELPIGNVTVRKLTIADWTAWYARDDAIAGLPRPVKFEDGMVVYTLAQ